VRTFANNTDTLQWILSDHLGSTSTTANPSTGSGQAADGTLNSVIQYTAFGEIRLTQGVTQTKYRYTGQLAQAELGLDYYVARWYDPLTGHFTQADTIIPEPGKSSSYDRFAYSNNNPIRYKDPSGHCADPDSCGPPPKKKVDPPKPPDPPCEAGENCQTQTPAATSTANITPRTILQPLPSSTPTPKSFLNSGPTNTPTQIPSKNSASSDLLSGYDLDAAIIGVSASGSEPGIYNTGGMEDLIFPDLSRATYNYGGQGGSYGLGANASTYFGVVLNIKNPESYIGPFGSAGLTISGAEVGLTAFYFWDSSKAPLSPGSTQGIAVGYAPGAHASVRWANTIYQMTWRTN
jgi:RHS repeat-associated protein